jgi:protein-S-isoprenylcysteine O-methyltransferase Ste14
VNRARRQIMKIDIRKIAVGWGRALFKVRSYTPIPVILVLLFCFRGELEKPVLTWSSGLLLLVLGEGVRLWSLRFMGKFSRTRKKKVRMLIKDGPYALVRNPLYWGNLLIILGFTVISDLLWLIPVVLILFFIQYQCIVLWEEECLREFFPSDAEDYFREVQRWLPSWEGLRSYLHRLQMPNYKWVNVFERERNTLQGQIVICVAIMAKDFFY